MRLPLYQVDAFARGPFSGNPAAVVLLDAWLPDATLQAIALENNLSETAYVVPRDAGYDLRWFTPSVEVDLCGHATLASAWVLFEYGDARGDEVVFQCRAGELRVARTGELLTMDFPSRPGAPREIDPALVAALGARPLEVRAARDLLAVFEREGDVRRLAPDMAAVAALDAFAVIATAPGSATDEADFVSRFFAPAQGVPEDPATGSAHCTLIPYWSERLGKTTLHGLQVSARTGEFFCEHRGERVQIAGRVHAYLRGEIEI
jgi:PhzF family phenazine biosynthesis protein